MLKVNICQFGYEDIPEAMCIEKQCFSVVWSYKALEDTLKNPSNYFICAKIKDKLVGYAGMYSVLDEGYIYNIAVNKKFRNKGIATKMINIFIKRSKDLNLKFISLEVRVSNAPAIRLYSKCGFEKCGIRKGFYDSPKEDAFIMTNFLK